MNAFRHSHAFGLPAVVFGAVVLFSLPHDLLGNNSFKVTDLISDIPGQAALTDPNLVNPWGITYSPTSPFWFSDNGAGVSTLYNASSGSIPSLVVTIPNPSGGTAAPTGAVFNGSSAFNADRFIFASEDGTISGWRGALGATAETLVDNSPSSAVYKGLATATVGGHAYLYATDFHNNKIDVVPEGGAPALAGSFTDPTLPAGFAPFNIQNLGGQLYVTYAKQDAEGKDDVAGAGNGYVDVYDLNGNLVRRLVSGGPLDSPWGLSMAPAGFGSFGGDLLVGNFGDGSINVFDPSSGAYLDALRNPARNPLVIDGLWGLSFGNGGSGGDLNTLYFTAGIPGDGAVEDHGLFGSLSQVPDETATLMLVAAGLVALIGFQRWPHRRARRPV